MAALLSSMFLFVCVFVVASAADMSGTTSRFWLWFSIFSIFIQPSSVEKKNITAESGQDVTLPCRAPNNKIIVVEWSRADLTPEFVFVYRNEQFDPENQHPSFKNRVDLQDKQMKDGDVSVILKNVTINDTGTYQCHVKRESGTMDPISIITLSVAPPGPGGTTEDGGKKGGVSSAVSRGRPGLLAVLGAGAVVVVVGLL